ncbi:carnitine 3-dehydrogenase [Sneathiella marina]|uniref:L-carnitine dehydrogenase n=1 Tax=Sneathiella marina TaxID=2950108 RepID=A0ABY4W0R4_9PROT|nr:carnitine 3-dehydrogenase [Sneathiella marina]USG60678.1 carnitine 3-dehydrogenase [Sneathiella marina]
MQSLSKVAIIGGGVIGGGWVARFLLNGIDVALYDPAPDALAKVTGLIENAERAYDELLGVNRPLTGNLSLAADIESAVRGADFIQESAPENLSLKRSILAEIDRFAPHQTLICSSTSGLRPTELQKGLSHPDRFMVGHPFNPVYLLPLVEICGGEQTSADSKSRAAEIYQSLGMKPLVLAKEIDAFIADRLLEAYWREALWLVKDGIATVEEIDDAIRYGAGLRWAMMGTFQVYRIAGGEAGMQHFLSQFGPSLKWPWTKLMEVPELDGDFIKLIARQSDDQAGELSIKELEQIRDTGLVGILKVLQKMDWGAGQVLGDYEAMLKAAKPASELDLRKPLPLFQTNIKSDWIDYNGHMTEHRYLQLFGETTDALLTYIGMDAAYLATGQSVYTLETHLRHLKEVAQGERVSVTTQLLGLDSKRVRLLHVMTLDRNEEVLATTEQMLMHVDTKAGRGSDFSAGLAASLSQIWTAHQNLQVPDFTGSGIRALTG